MATQLKSMQDEPNTSREYETIFILRPDTANDAVAQVNARLRGILDQMGGKVLKLDNWGKRKLAYEVRKQLKGIYLYWRYLATSGVVEEVERNLRMLDSVIRYYTVKVDADIVADARPTEVTDETWSKASETAADEEEIMTGQAPRSPFFDDEDDEIYADAE
jgi:small subunit ribosomal protein S6